MGGDFLFDLVFLLTLLRLPLLSCLPLCPLLFSFLVCPVFNSPRPSMSLFVPLSFPAPSRSTVSSFLGVRQAGRQAAKCVDGTRLLLPCKDACQLCPCEPTSETAQAQMR